MPSRERKPWEERISYTEPIPDSPGDDDDDDGGATSSFQIGAGADATVERGGTTVSGRDITDPPPDPSRRVRTPGEFASLDTTPIDYSKGPHDEIFGDEDDDDIDVDTAP